MRSRSHTLLFGPTQPPVLISPANQTAHHHFSKIISLTVLTHVRYATHGGSMHCPKICHHTHVLTVVRCQCTRYDIIHSLSHIRTIAIAFSMLAYLHDMSGSIASHIPHTTLSHRHFHTNFSAHFSTPALCHRNLSPFTAQHQPTYMYLSTPDTLVVLPWHEHAPFSSYQPQE